MLQTHSISADAATFRITEALLAKKRSGDRTNWVEGEVNVVYEVHGSGRKLEMRYLISAYLEFAKSLSLVRVAGSSSLDPGKYTTNVESSMTLPTVIQRILFCLGPFIPDSVMDHKTNKNYTSHASKCGIHDHPRVTVPYAPRRQREPQAAVGDAQKHEHTAKPHMCICPGRLLLENAVSLVVPVAEPRHEQHAHHDRCAGNSVEVAACLLNLSTGLP